MNKLSKSLIILFLAFLLESCFGIDFVQAQNNETNLKIIKECGIKYVGESCVAELKMTNNTSEILDGEAFLHIDYQGICSSKKLVNFDGEGIEAQFSTSTNDNWLSFSGWKNGTTTVSGFNIVKGETHPNLKIRTLPNLCPGEYTFTLTLEGTAEAGETYTAGVFIGGVSGYYTPPTPTTPTTDTGEVTATPGEGGVTTLFNSDGSGIELIVPEGAVSGNTVFTIKTVDINSINQPSPESGLFLINGLVYEIKAEVDGEFITTFDKPLTLTFTYTEDQIEGIEEDSLKIYWWDGKDWVVLGNSEVDRDDNTVTASINHFTLFALLGEEEDIIPEGKTEEGMGEETEEGEIISGEEIISEESEEEAVIEEGEPQEGEAKVVQETDDRRGWLAAIGVIPLNLKVLLGIAIVVIIGLIVLKVIRMRRKTQ